VADARLEKRGLGRNEGGTEQHEQKRKLEETSAESGVLFKDKLAN
jgi:hypothetical protein